MTYKYTSGLPEDKWLLRGLFMNTTAQLGIISRSSATRTRELKL